MRGKKEPLPPSLLPKQVDAALRSLGDDGEKVRGTLEREFANYLEKRKPDEDKGLLGGITGALAAGLVVPASRTFARRLASQLVNVDEADFRKALDGLRGSAPSAGRRRRRPSRRRSRPVPAGVKPPTVR